MRLKAPCQGIDFHTYDIYGTEFKLSDLVGKRILVSFFRDAACPFCNFRIYELTHKYTEWKSQGLEIVAFFSSPANEVRHHVAKHPRPFRMVSDPALTIYNQYGVEHSVMALVKALLFKMPRIVKGIATGGRPRPNPHVKLVPADFLFSEDGRIQKIWYGRDTSDHIPIQSIQDFIRQKPKAFLRKRRLEQPRKTFEPAGGRSH